MSTMLTLFTSEMTRAEAGDADCGEKPYSVVSVFGDNTYFNLHVDDTQRGREIALAILAACDRTDIVRAAYPDAEPTDHSDDPCPCGEVDCSRPIGHPEEMVEVA